MGRIFRHEKSVVIGTLLVFASVVASFYFARELILTASSDKQEIVHEGPIRIATIDWVGFYPLAAAYEAGWAKEELAQADAELQLILLRDNIEMSDYVRTGQAEGCFGVMVDFVIMRGIDFPVRMILATDYSKTDMIIAKKSIKTKFDLAGKKIGISDINSFADYFLIRALEREKINTKQIQFKAVHARNVPEAISNGEIDAGHTWEPDLARGLKMGHHVVLSSASRPLDIVSGLLIRTDVLQRPGVGEAILRSYFRGLELKQKDPDHFSKLVGRFYGQPPEHIRKVMDSHTALLDAEANLEALKPNGTLSNELVSILQFFENRGINYGDAKSFYLFDHRPVHAVLANSRLISKSNAKLGKIEP